MASGLHSTLGPSSTIDPNSEATSRCRREKSKTVHAASNKQALHKKQLPCASQTPKY